MTHTAWHHPLLLQLVLTWRAHQEDDWGRVRDRCLKGEGNPATPPIQRGAAIQSTPTLQIPCYYRHTLIWTSC